MTILTETRHAAEFIMSEGNGKISRAAITIASGEGVIAPGEVLGKVSADTGAVSVAAPVFAGTGGGTLTRATPAYGAGVLEGVYRITCIEPAAGLGTFSIEGPNGVAVGIATVGAAFDGVIKFTIADGTPDFAAGDTFTLAVTIADAASAGSYRKADPTNTDGSGVACAIAIYGGDATSAALTLAGLVRDAEVNGNLLTYAATVDDAPKKAAKVAELAAANLIVR